MNYKQALHGKLQLYFMLQWCTCWNNYEFTAFNGFSLLWPIIIITRTQQTNTLISTVLWDVKFAVLGALHDSELELDNVFAPKDL